MQPWFNHHCCQFPSEYKIQVFLLSVEGYRKQPWMAFFLHKVSQAFGVITSSTALLKFNCTVSAAVCIHKAYICSCVGLSFCYNLSWLHPGWTRGVCGLHFYSAVQGELNGSTWSQQSPTGLASRYFSSLLCWRMELYGGLQARFGESLTKNDLPVVPSLAHRDLNWMELWFFLNHNSSEIINGHQD